MLSGSWEVERSSGFTSFLILLTTFHLMSVESAWTTWRSHVEVAVDLEAWEARLDELGVVNGGIVEAEYGSALSCRDPDNIALEFFAPAT